MYQFFLVLKRLCFADIRNVFDYRHARKYFSTVSEEQHLSEIQKVMGLLAFPSDTQISSYKVSLKLVSGDILKLILLFFEEIKTSHFM